MIKALLAKMNGASLAAILLGLLLAPIGNDALAYEGINECKIFKTKMRNQFTELSLMSHIKACQNALV